MGPKRFLDALTVEEALQININDAAFTVSMRTPGEDANLVRGLLHAEGVINDVNFTPDIVLKKENEDGIVTIVNVAIPEDKLGEGYTNSRSLLSVSSCGICGKTQLEDLAFMGKTIDNSQKIDSATIDQMFATMRSKQHDFNQSGGTHAAAAFSLEGQMLACLEDIGRHNAVDKVVGKLIHTDQLKKAKVLTVSGRISYEIVIKCFKSQLPFFGGSVCPVLTGSRLCKRIRHHPFWVLQRWACHCVFTSRKNQIKTNQHKSQLINVR